MYYISSEGDTLLNDICLNITPLVLYVNADKDKVIAIKRNRKSRGFIDEYTMNQINITLVQE
jgi:hypothetical protein